MAIKLHDTQISAIIRREEDYIHELNQERLKQFRESKEYLEIENKVVAEVALLSKETRDVLYVRSTEESLREKTFHVMSDKAIKENNKFFIPYPDRKKLRQNLIIASIESKNLQDAMTEAGFTYHLIK